MFQRVCFYCVVFEAIELLIQRRLVEQNKKKNKTNAEYLWAYIRFSVFEQKKRFKENMKKKKLLLIIFIFSY